MDTLEMKIEFFRRYCYLYNLSLNLYGAVCSFSDKKRELSYNKLMLRTIEDFMLSDKKLCQSEGYKALKNMSNLSMYYKMMLLGMRDREIKKKNRDYAIGEILAQLYDYIEMQSIDLENRDRKLQVIDEYIRMSRYKNDGMIWTSGRKINLHDIMQCNIFSVSIPPKGGPNREENGVLNNEFINAFSCEENQKNSSSIHISENEKQAIFLKFHDVIPWNLEITCQNYNINICNCGKKINKIVESEIYVSEYDDLFHYICPFCIEEVTFDKKLLSNSIQERIILKNEKTKKGKVLEKI